MSVEIMSITKVAPVIMLKWRAYYDLTKPKVVALLVLTAVVGMSLSVPGGLPWQLFIPAMLGIGLVSSAAAAINHIVDEKIDAIMGRTHNRPLPEGRVSTNNAIVFAWRNNADAGRQ